MSHYSPQEKRRRLEQDVFPILRCIACPDGRLELRADEIACLACGQRYPVHESIPVMTLSPEEASHYHPTLVLENPYSDQWLQLLEAAGDGRVLDLGSGNNPNRWDRLIKMDVFTLPHVDVVGIAEALPFKDGVFRSVFSGAVFEHVMDPFVAIDQVHRVLEPGGAVYIETAFLQPMHAYPNHYFNMTLAGLERVCWSFERVDSGARPHQYPSFTLHWILKVWSEKLTGRAKKDFLSATVGEILEEYSKDVFSKRWLTGFTKRDLEQLACGVYFQGKKREKRDEAWQTHPPLFSYSRKPTFMEHFEDLLLRIYRKLRQ